MTKESFTQIGKQLLATAITPNGFSDKFNELRRIKTNIQNEIADILTPKEQQDVMLSVKNETTINKLIIIGKRYYNQNPTDERAYMIAMSIGTIIKEYGWGIEYTIGDGLYNLGLKISSN